MSNKVVDKNNEMSDAKELEQQERARQEHIVLQNKHLVQYLLWSDAQLGPEIKVTTLTDLSTPAWVWDNLLNNAECDRLINATNSLGYGHTDYNRHLRGNLRLICDDGALAAELWQRVQPLLPPNFSVDFYGKQWKPVGLNSRFRFSKYYPGDKFTHHCDDCVVLNTNYRSMYTLNIYLNDNSAATRVYMGQRRSGRGEIIADPDYYEDVLPLAGRALVFQQLPTAQVLHEGLLVELGNKYLMRTDIMFEPM